MMKTEIRVSIFQGHRCFKWKSLNSNRLVISSLEIVFWLILEYVLALHMQLAFYKPMMLDTL